MPRVFVDNLNFADPDEIVLIQNIEIERHQGLPLPLFTLFPVCQRLLVYPVECGNPLLAPHPSAQQPGRFRKCENPPSVPVLSQTHAVR
jgi:hypothetical protein